MRAFLLLLLLLCSACTPVEAARSQPQPVPAPSPFSVRVFFTNAENRQTLRGGPDTDLAEAIDQARLTVDFAIYDLNLWSVRDALLDAQERGVTVRLVVDDGRLAESAELQQLQAAGLSLVTDGSDKLMHNKFIVIDGYEVCTGSMNLTISDVYFSRNNMVCLPSSDLAALYSEEFEEMFEHRVFGEDSPMGTAHTFEFEMARVEVLFSPDDGTAERLVELVENATLSIKMLAFSFTSDVLADALIAAEKRGVEVMIVLDEGQAVNNEGTEFWHLVESGLNVRLDGEPGNLHHKLLIIDAEIVVTGSYNFSRNAEERNDENTLVLYHAPTAAAFEDEFWQIWDIAQH